MKRLGSLFLMFTLLATAASSAPKKKRATFDPSLPLLGTQFHTLPDGAGKETAEASCLQCHSADVLAQQRLNEKQWTASVEKMVRWGAVLDDAKKAELVAYLAKNFGPENQFTPIKVRM
ncbi:MAG: hypothetical protein JOZ54_03795 [Acidobacteria bacterium]|nr:hypothetical protein [Acidobacteriota bacterium]